MNKVKTIVLSSIEQINQISDGYGEALNLKHYVVITQNYNIDIVTDCKFGKLQLNCFGQFSQFKHTFPF